MFALVTKHLSVKLLLALVAILVGSFTALCLSILAKQDSLLGDMQSTVAAKLQRNNDEAQVQFKTIEGHVESAIAAMGDHTATNLTAMTTDALKAERLEIEKSMNAMLLSSATAVADLLANVGKDDIMAKKGDKLLEFSRSVAKSDEVVFAFFFDKDNILLPSYVDLLDPHITTYLKADEDAVDKAAQVLAGAKTDPTLLIHEKTIDFYNLPIGKVVLGITKDSVNKQLAALTASFDALNTNNSKGIRSIIGEESVKVSGLMQDDFGQVATASSKSRTETGAFLVQSAGKVYTGTTWMVAIVGSLCCLGVVIAVGLMLQLMVIRPIKGITAGLRDTAEGEGDLTKRLVINRQDEIGELAGWFNTFIAKLNTIIIDIGANAETVSSSSLETLAAAEQMLEESDNLHAKANTVAAASEEMNVSMSSVAAASEEAATNISIVADAAAEMKNALDGVVEECRKAQGVSHSATDKVRSATEKVGLLGEAAREIDKVSQVITEIADQTNLLALNATIEAARAGDAGKGFAVVAGEIKNLAQQTQLATKEIKAKIDSIQTSTNDTVSEVGQIAAVIGEVDTIFSAIARSIDAESERSAEVARNIDQAAQGIAEVNENVAQSSQVSAQIAGDMAEVSQVAGQMSTRSEQMKTSSGGLSDLAAQLRKMISVFKVSHSEALQQSEGRLASGQEVADLIPWNQKLILGIDAIDNQHKELVRLINMLHAAMKNKAGASEAGRVIDELSRYTSYHFKFEENLFAKFHYPATAAHQKAHQELVAKVVQFQQEFHQGRAGLSMDLMYFLTDWLKGHILQTDKAYVPFFKDKNI